VTFNEMVVYKNGSNAESVNTESEAEKPDFIGFDEISNGTNQRRNSKVDEDSEAEQDPEVEETEEQQIE
jgi:hypothetical protein